jgi:ribosomal protein L11 methyltransferase
MMSHQTYRWQLSTIISVPDVPVFADAIDAYAESMNVFEAHPPDGTWSIHAVLREGFDRAGLRGAIGLAAAANGCEEPPVEITPLADTDWLSRVAEDFPPFTVDKIYIHGSHVRATPADGPIRLRIDAGTAFGSGEHPTTQGCLMALQDLAKRWPSITSPRWERSTGEAGRVRGDMNLPSPSHSCRNGSLPLPSGRGAELCILDMGCGSGILSLAAAHLWNAEIVAVDIDTEAVRVTRDNARINGVAGCIRAGAGKGYRAPILARALPFDLIVSNILANPLRRMAPDVARHLRPGGHAILSGLLRRQQASVLAAYRAHGLRLVKRYPIGEWQTLVLGK